MTKNPIENKIYYIYNNITLLKLKFVKRENNKNVFEYFINNKSNLYKPVTDKFIAETPEEARLLFYKELKEKHIKKLDFLEKQIQKEKLEFNKTIEDKNLKDIEDKYPEYFF